MLLTLSKKTKVLLAHATIISDLFRTRSIRSTQRVAATPDTRQRVAATPATPDSTRRQDLPGVGPSGHGSVRSHHTSALTT